MSIAELQKRLRDLPVWPYSGLDKKRQVVIFSPASFDDLEAAVAMFDTFEPKGAVQGLPPLNRDTRIRWIKNTLKTGLNIKTESEGRIVALGSLFPMEGGERVEIGLFVSNERQYRGVGRLLIDVLAFAARKTGFKRVWVSEQRDNARAVGLYHRMGFKQFQRELAEFEFELDLAEVGDELDLSGNQMPVVEVRAEVKPPDYLADQELGPETSSVLIYSEEFAGFKLGPGHPFLTERSDLAMDLIRRMELDRLPGLQVMEPRPLDEGSVLSYHNERYYYYLQMASEGAFIPQMFEYGLGVGDNPIALGALDYFMLAAGASVMGADLLRGNERVRLVFSPTGGFHHGGPNYAAGFCYINDVALAIKYLLEQGARVLYMDIDAHHGDGVQLAFYEEPRVLKISLHESGRTLFPWNSGFENELGAGAGFGYNVNVPLAPGTEDDIYLDAFDRVAVPLARKFAADVCVACVGVDTMFSDPLSHLSLSNNAYAEAVRRIGGMAPKLLMLGAGGYNADNIGRDWTLAWAVLHDAEPEDDYFGQAGTRMSASEVGGVSLRDMRPFVSPMKIAEASVEAQRVIEYIEERVFPVHGL